LNKTVRPRKQCQYGNSCRENGAEVRPVDMQQSFLH
jgi:hypothetical protein